MAPRNLIQRAYLSGLKALIEEKVTASQMRITNNFSTKDSGPFGWDFKPSEGVPCFVLAKMHAVHVVDSS